MRQVEKDLLLEQVRITGQCSVRVGGFCMMPVIRNGAMVSIRHQPMSRLSIGDIAAYFIGEKLLVHRLIEIHGETLVFRGDSASSEIHEVPYQSILGIVMEIRNQSLIQRILRKAQSVWQTRTTIRQAAETATAGSGQSR
jgi:hypothetical protein